MIDRFLKAKHWQLFALMFGIPMLFQIIMMQQIFSASINNGPEDLAVFIHYFRFIPLIMFLWIGIFYGWMWSMGIGLGAKLPETLRLKTLWFKLAIIFPFVYMLFFGYFMSTLFAGFPNDINEPNPSLFVFILPFHLLTMICNFYCFYFVARTFKTAELKRRVQFGDFVGEFFLMWFFFVGVWILQPKVNKLAIEEIESKELV